MKKAKVNKIKDKNFRKKALISILISTFLILLFLTINFQLKNEKLEGEISEKKRLIHKYRENVERLNEIRDKYRVLRKDYESIKQKFFSGKNESIAYAKFLSFINNLLQKYKLKKTYATRMPSEELNSFKIIRLFIRLQSEDLRPVLRFIYELENNNEKQLIVEKVDIKVRQSKEDKVLYYIELVVGGIWEEQ